MLSYHNVLFFSILYGIFSSKYTLTYLLIIFKRSFSTILRDDFLKNLMLLLRTTLSTFLKHKSEQTLYLIIYIYIYLCIYYIYCIPSLPYYVMSYRTVCFRIFISNRAHNDVSSNRYDIFIFNGPTARYYMHNYMQLYLIVPYILKQNIVGQSVSRNSLIGPNFGGGGV